MAGVWRHDCAAINLNGVPRGQIVISLGRWRLSISPLSPHSPSSQYLLIFQRQFNGDEGSALGQGLGAYVAVVVGDERAYDGKSEPGTAAFA